MQQLRGEFQCGRHVAALCRHQFRFQRGYQVGDGVIVVGQRRHGECRRRVNDQRGLATLPGADQVVDLELGALDTRWLDVGRLHRLRQVERNHQRGFLTEHRLWQFFPDRAGQCDNADAGCNKNQQHRQLAGFPATRGEYVGQQLVIADRFPAAAGRLAGHIEHDEQQQRYKSSEGFGTQEVQLLRDVYHYLHLRLNNAASASTAASTSAMPSGQ